MDKDTPSLCASKPFSGFDPSAPRNLGDDATAPPRAVSLAERLALTADESAAAYGLSPRFWAALDSAGKIPRALKFGKAKRWSVDTLREWTRRGCPSRAEWERLHETK